jgi:hypothetical protein
MSIVLRLRAHARYAHWKESRSYDPAITGPIRRFGDDGDGVSKARAGFPAAGYDRRRGDPSAAHGAAGMPDPRPARIDTQPLPSEHG